MWFFVHSPPIGWSFKWKSREFRCVESREHQRKDGEMTTIVTWATVCPVCKEGYKFTTGLKGVTPRSVCPSCLALPREKRSSVLAERPFEIRRKPSIDEMLFGVAELPAGLSASLAKRAWNWAPKLLKRQSKTLAKYTVYEIDAGLSDAIAEGRVRYCPVGYNKWSRPVWGLMCVSEADAAAMKQEERRRILAGESLFD